jgi:hypothetical protein
MPLLVSESKFATPGSVPIGRSVLFVSMERLPQATNTISNRNQRRYGHFDLFSPAQPLIGGCALIGAAGKILTLSVNGIAYAKVYLFCSSDTSIPGLQHRVCLGSRVAEYVSCANINLIQTPLAIF